MKIRINHDDENLYCLYSKEPIEIGEKFIEVEDKEYGYLRVYKLEYAPVVEEDEEEPYIGE